MFSKCSTVAGFFRSGCWRGTIVFKPVKGLLAWRGQSYMYMPTVSQEYVYIHLCKIKVQMKTVALQIWAVSHHSSHSVQYEPWKIVCQDSSWSKTSLRRKQYLKVKGWASISIDSLTLAVLQIFPSALYLTHSSCQITVTKSTQISLSTWPYQLSVWNHPSSQLLVPANSSTQGF